MKVLVIGGAGYIGGAVTDELSYREINFTVFDNLTYNAQYLKPCPFIHGDVRDTRALSEAIRDHTHIIWLAAIVGDAACNIDRRATRDINMAMVPQYAADRKIFGGRRIVFASSCSVYGYSKDQLHEGSELNPQSYYAELKIQAEDWLRDKCPDSVLLRFGTAYGRSDEHSRLRFDLAINRMAVMAAVEGRIEVHGGEQWRPWASVHDIAYACCEALDTDAGTYNIVTGNYQIKEVADLVAKAIRQLGHVKIDHYRSIDPRDYHVIAMKALSLGLIPPLALTDIPTAAADLAGIGVAKRVANWKAPIHSNEAWLKRQVG